ncbi:MAG: hypothetical protein NUV84_00305 [Candidatus Uhrbacteria bacterium]|nr:hypothetical protein [Candidatus Uhrbacteria bacterium]
MWLSFLTITAGFITWGLNERSKRIAEDFSRKETKYMELIRCLQGFYVGSEDKDLKAEFLKQLNLCWMYCPDDVIRKVYQFLGTIHTDPSYGSLTKEDAVGEIMLAIRQDLIERKRFRNTELTARDFQHLKVY